MTTRLDTLVKAVEKYENVMSTTFALSTTHFLEELRQAEQEVLEAATHFVQGHKTMKETKDRE